MSSAGLSAQCRFVVTASTDADWKIERSVLCGDQTMVKFGEEW
jgi:hypothetical protein